MNDPRIHEAMLVPAPAALPKPGRDAEGHFIEGNRLSVGAGRFGRQKIANIVYQRALEFMNGDIQPQPEDVNNPLIQIMLIARNTNDPELALQAWDKCCRYVFGTRSNLSLDLADHGDGEANAGNRRLAFALGMLKE